jgi:hypothetical protein
MKELLEEIARIKNNEVVFVGSVTLWNSKLIDNVSDIDMVVRNLDGLEVFGEVITWDTESPMSLSGKRAYIERDDYNLDIFIEPILPPYFVIAGLNFQALDDLKKHIEWCVSVSDGEFKNKMIAKELQYTQLIQNINNGTSGTSGTSGTI